MNVWNFKEEHILERIKERAKYVKGGLDASAEYERIKKSLEKNVPDDWRLSRFSGDFLIRDLKVGITLIGHQTRARSTTTIIKNINSALATGGFSKGKLGKHGDSPDAFDIAKRPNLFIGDESHHEIFKTSPVLARQYEKVYYDVLSKTFNFGNSGFVRQVLAKSPYEYFRLHPLKADGIDQNNYLWMQWGVNGYCRFWKGTPPKEYHGEDFWHLSTE